MIPLVRKKCHGPASDLKTRLQAENLGILLDLLAAWGRCGRAGEKGALQVPAEAVPEGHAGQKVRQIPAPVPVEDEGRVHVQRPDRPDQFPGVPGLNRRAAAKKTVVVNRDHLVDIRAVVQNVAVGPTDDERYAGQGKT